MTWDKHAYLKALTSSKLSPTKRAIVRVLADEFADRTGKCWPSYQTLADSTGYSRRTVYRNMTDLESDGWLRKVPRPRERRDWDSNLYYLMPRFEVGTECPQVGTDDPQGRDTVSPNPPNEPSNKENPSSRSAPLNGLHRDQDQLSHATRCEAITLITADECEFTCERTTRHPSRRCWQHQQVAEPRVLYRWGFTVGDLLDEFGIEKDDLPLGTSMAIDSMMCKGYTRSRILNFVIKRMKEHAA